MGGILKKIKDLNEEEDKNSTKFWTSALTPLGFIGIIINLLSYLLVLDLSDENTRFYKVVFFLFFYSLSWVWMILPIILRIIRKKNDKGDILLTQQILFFAGVFVLLMVLVVVCEVFNIGNITYGGIFNN
ncbi:MAG: hypothetical protein JXR81_03030 [Candidatus Goldbacteria bacterium]|nr:hypothetical protein [Candidatus Goldiibacteriota bacterium]